MIKKIEQILESTLMISVKNIANELNTETSLLHESLYQLESMNKLRLANGSSCGSSCSACGSSCTTEVKKTITDRTIIISLIHKSKISGDE
jgi:heterodisulfide reductase subunit C